LKKQSSMLIVILFLVGFLCGCINPQTTEYFNKVIAADEFTVLNVSIIKGGLEIHAWNNDTIQLNAIKKSAFGQNELDKVEINVEKKGNDIEIEAIYTGDKFTPPSVDMNIKVPPYITVDTVTTSNGAIQISGVNGDLIATSSNGAIIIDNVDGYISALTSNGRIEVTGSTGIKNLQSSNLGIIAEIYDFKDNISITTSNGGISVYFNPLLHADVEMKTSNGQISFHDIALNMSMNDQKHKIGSIGDGGNIILIQTSNGNIQINKLYN
jgi:hypothetical protein